MKEGQLVKVFPVGEPGSSAEGVVQIISRNGLSVAVLFADKPPWKPFLGVGVFVGPQGIVLLATKGPEGLWADIVDDQQYYIHEHTT